MALKIVPMDPMNDSDSQDIFRTLITQMEMIITQNYYTNSTILFFIPDFNDFAWLEIKLNALEYSNGKRILIIRKMLD